MTGNQPTRTNQGGNQSKGGNYENPGGDVNGTMGTPSANRTMRVMNNGGGPEPHQGSNPGAQSDPGPKEIGFYDQTKNHVLGDDGVQAAVERPSPMRMGGVEEPESDHGQTGARTYGNSGGGAMGAEARNPVGFAASMTTEPSATHVPGHAGRSGGIGAQGTRSGIIHDETTQYEPDRSSYADGQGSEGSGYVYQSRAAQMLVDMRNDESSAYARMDEPAEDAAPRAADKAGEVADAVKAKAGGFFSNAKDRVEGFLSVDLDNDGSVGTHGESDPYQSPNGETREMGYERDTPGTRPFEPGKRYGSYGDKRGVAPQAFETREAVQRAAANTGEGSYGDFNSETSHDRSMPALEDRSVMQADGVSRTEAEKRELVDA